MSRRRGASHVYQMALGLLLALTVVAVQGCGGPPPAPPIAFEGAVVWQDGQDAGELEGSSIEFEANGTVAAKATLQSDGTFSMVDPLPPGQYRARIVPVAGRPGATLLDSRFQKFESSGLKVTSPANPPFVRFKVSKRS